jgi:hypothetical protein
LEPVLTKNDSIRLSLFEQPEAKVGLWPKTKLLFVNKCYVLLVAASAFRFFGGYALGFGGATFWIHRYPDHVDQYAYMNTIIVVGGGLPASMLGGYLSDKLEKRYGNIKGLVCGLGALAATPFIVFTYII